MDEVNSDKTKVPEEFFFRGVLLINLLACQVSLHSMHSTSVYDPQLLVLEGAEEKALATDHRVDVFCDILLNRRTATWNVFVEYIIVILL